MEPELVKKVTRQAVVAGKFYPGSEEKLLSEIENLCREAKQLSDPEHAPRALIVPHAGYVFSGKVAASAYNQLLPGNFPRRVFILASSHYHHFPGVSVFCSGNYETPLGLVDVDIETGRKLLNDNPLFTNYEEVHTNEHSLEVQLPFLQYKQGRSLRIVPLVLGSHKQEDSLKLAEALRPYFTSDNLFVISSDLSHYPCYDDAVKTDRNTTESILTNSPGNLMQVLENNRKQKIPGLTTSLCGWSSVLTLLHLTEGRNYSYQWIDYQNSGDQPLYGDHNRVVGYSAVAVYANDAREFSLSFEDKQSLIHIAENAIRNYVLSGKRNSGDKGVYSGKLNENWGAFVSIYNGEKLRGCIGRFENDGSLSETVREVAASAAADRRFLPVSKDELDDLAIEISVLSPLKKISSSREIVLGKHGIYLKKGWSSGTFLPQVAEKYGWTVEEFLGRCSRDKAGIGWDGWKSAELYTYEAIVFGKDD
jgi:AmmeMemoRadiSam system protein B/AmmeMemoRadiSam system protein A